MIQKGTSMRKIDLGKDAVWGNPLRAVIYLEKIALS